MTSQRLEPPATSLTRHTSPPTRRCTVEPSSLPRSVSRSAGTAHRVSATAVGGARVKILRRCPHRWGVCPRLCSALQLDAVLRISHGVIVTDWNTFAPGDEADVNDDGSTAKVVCPKKGVLIVRRFFDGSWQNTVWIRQIDGDWGVARELGAVGTRMPDLSAAVSEGILRSREALKKH